MRAAAIILILCATAQAISTQDADKMVSNYEKMTQRIMGFMNCLSRAITGSDIMKVGDASDVAKSAFSGNHGDGIGACFKAQGMNVNLGVGNAFSKKEEPPPEEVRQEGMKQFQQMAPHQPVAQKPPQPATTRPTLRQPASNSAKAEPVKVKTRW